MRARRVVITGMGVISPVGLNVPTMWENLTSSRSGIGPITLFDASNFASQIAGEAHGFDPLEYMPARDARRSDRFTQFAIAALHEVEAQSRHEMDSHSTNDIGVIVGSGIRSVETYTQELDGFREKGPRRVSPVLIPMITVDFPAVQIALRTGARGPSFAVSSACATGSDAIGQSYETILRGRAKAMFAGSFEATVNPITIASLDRMRAVSRRNDDPAGASRPFDAERDGFVAAEGGGILLLEEISFALARGAKPLAEVVGYAATSDAIHVTAPDANGKGAARCMSLAMERAGVSPSDISYINAHGTSTWLGDLAETNAIKEAMGEQTYRVPISSTKSMTGHLAGGAGALEAAICVQALRTGIIPPTINLETPDRACNLDYVPNRSRAAGVEITVSNSFGFGGHNAALVLRAYRG